MKIKKLFVKIHKIIQPKKYKLNHILPIAKLKSGDKLYAIYLPHLEYRSITSSANIINKVCVTEMKVMEIHLYKLGDDNYMDIKMQAIIDKDTTYDMCVSLRQEQEGNNTIRVLYPQTIKVKDVFYSLVIKKYDANIIITTDKNVIIDYLKQYTNTIKTRINGITNQDEKLISETTWENVTNYDNVTKQNIIKNFKQQYNKIINKLIII